MARHVSDENFKGMAKNFLLQKLAFKGMKKAMLIFMKGIKNSFTMTKEEKEEYLLSRKNFLEKMKDFEKRIG